MHIVIFKNSAMSTTVDIARVKDQQEAALATGLAHSTVVLDDLQLAIYVLHPDLHEVEVCEIIEFIRPLRWAKSPRSWAADYNWQQTDRRYER